MEERIRALVTRFTTWWNKFTTKQKVIISGITVAVIVSLVVLVAVLNRTQYQPLRECETTQEASAIRDLLVAEDIPYTISTDGKSISVDASRLSDANLLLGANGYSTVTYSIDNVTDGGFGTTEADKQKRYVFYLESHLEEDLSKFTAVKSADVQLSIPSDTGTLIAEAQDSSAMVLLELEGEFTTDNAAFLAKAVATALGNASTEHITIMDYDGNLLYSGDDSYSISGSAGSQLAVKQQAEGSVKSNVKQVLLGTNLYDNIEVASNLVIDFSEVKDTTHDYSAPEGQTQGMLASDSNYSSESTNGSGAAPGTDSNDGDITYTYDTNGNSSTTIEQSEHQYLPNEHMNETVTPPGSIVYNQSSVSVTAIAYNIINEDTAKDQGLLDGLSWEEYKAANSERTRIDVDADLYGVVANATGFPEENISIVAYEENWFVDSPGLGVSGTDILQVVLIVLILGLLGFVVLRSLKTDKTPVVEEEISVEDLLQSTPEAPLQDVELETKSEARRMIEKFVDENPEAVASLLKTWLSEEWG